MKISAYVDSTNNGGSIIWWHAGVAYIDGVEPNPKLQLAKQVGIGQTREEALEDLKQRLKNPDVHLIEFEI